MYTTQPKIPARAITMTGIVHGEVSELLGPQPQTSAEIGVSMSESRGLMVSTIGLTQITSRFSKAPMRCRRSASMLTMREVENFFWV